jgi:hypothetical protein
MSALIQINNAARNQGYHWPDGEGGLGVVFAGSDGCLHSKLGINGMGSSRDIAMAATAGMMPFAAGRGQGLQRLAFQPGVPRHRIRAFGFVSGAAGIHTGGRCD